MTSYFYTRCNCTCEKSRIPCSKQAHRYSVALPKRKDQRRVLRVQIYPNRATDCRWTYESAYKRKIPHIPTSSWPRRIPLRILNSCLSRYFEWMWKLSSFSFRFRASLLLQGGRGSFSSLSLRPQLLLQEGCGSSFTLSVAFKMWELF